LGTASLLQNRYICEHFANFGSDVINFLMTMSFQSDSYDYVSICCANMALIYLLQGHVDEAMKWGNNALTEAGSFYNKKSQEVLLLLYSE
jgi:hypothetical protein